MEKMPTDDQQMISEDQEQLQSHENGESESKINEHSSKEDYEMNYNSAAEHLYPNQEVENSQNYREISNNAFMSISNED